MIKLFSCIPGPTRRRFDIPAALEHAEVHEHARSVSFDEVSRAGNFTSGSVKGDFHDC
jgi:hypothetical protein